MRTRIPYGLPAIECCLGAFGVLASSGRVEDESLPALLCWQRQRRQRGEAVEAQDIEPGVWSCARRRQRAEELGWDTEATRAERFALAARMGSTPGKGARAPVPAWTRLVLALPCCCAS